MDENEQDIFEQIIGTELKDYVEADQDAVDFLDVLAQDLANKGTTESLFKSFTYATPTGKAVFTTEQWRDHQETAVVVILGDDNDDEDDGEEIFELMFNAGNELEQYGIDDEHADEAQEVMKYVASERTLTDAEKLMARHIGAMVFTCDPEQYLPGVYFANGNDVHHVADIIKSAVERLATCTREVRKYAYAQDEHRSLHVAFSSLIATDPRHKDATGQSLLATYIDGVLGRKYIYRRDEDGNQTFGTVPLEPLDGSQTHDDTHINGLTNQNVDFMMNLLLPRVFNPEP